MLKNIKFKDVRVDVRGIGSISRVLIRWSLEPTYQNLRNLFFYIDRGEAETDMQPINATPLPAGGRYEFMDYTGKLKDLTKVYYYRVRAVELSPCSKQVLQTISSNLATWEDPPDLVSLYVLEEHLFAHKYVFGMPALIFPKMHEGVHCECRDEVLKRVTNSHCKVCYGTGWVGGYYPPVEAWMDFSPSPEMVTIADFGVKQAQQTDAQFTDYPNMQIGDLVLQIRPYILWRVENIRTTTKNYATLLQVCRMNEVNKSDIEYAIDVPMDIVDKLSNELRERELTPEF